ncbi:class II glutamine amidotransferase [Actinoplanes awajinensis]|uniref:Glutamine amidotransferase n=1 Tax=Actinoplanes awajinensis subsp. mycoplanecinus TaxID=135947 RepID=A0A101JJU8_9ACTN|nr:class II glutamine amidotransferase [Actinoplanes awajinensis]KUL28160.1 glutamine amidotransferase [Actinoplanes awajinensis subsp. mycoplanecinus]
MCRWLAYSGTPIRLEELLYKPQYSLIDQSLHSRLGVETTNGDGFGVGWYPVDGPPAPALFRGTGPAWNDANLREIAGSISSPLFLAHIRASTGTAVQQTNCHPFRHENWLWVHNGSIREFSTLKRDLTLAVDPRLYPSLAGSTDSEVMFHLALTYGLRDRPVAAVERMAGLVEAVGRAHGVADPLQMTVATTDGDRIWCFRYSSEGHSRSLYFSTETTALQALYPENRQLRALSEETRLVVSEPLGDLEGAWQPVPESSYGVIQKGADEMGRFTPAAP